MTLKEKLQSSIFWKNTFRISLLFFSAIIIVSLLFNSFTSIINFDLQTIRSENFSDDKWRGFFLPKMVISVLYGMWVTARNMK